MGRKIFAVGLVLLLLASSFGILTEMIEKKLPDITDVVRDTSELINGRNDNGLFAQWHFDDGTGNHVQDSSGNGNHGTLNVGGDNVNNKWVKGVWGKAIDFDGQDDYMDTGIQYNDYENGITCSAWINGNAWGVSSSWIGWNMVASSGTDSSNDGFNFGIDSSGKLRLRISHNPSYVIERAVGIGNQILAPNTWYHVSFTWDGTQGNDKIKLYINGNVDKSLNSGNSNPGMVSSMPLLIGRCTFTTADYFNGIIDEVALYKRELKADEIMAISKGLQIEEDEYGGSWFDNFQDESGIEYKANVSLKEGSLRLQTVADLNGSRKLMLHLDGPDDSTLFHDDSISAHPVTHHDDAQIKTDQSKFGGSSVYFDGSGDYLSIPNSDDWNFGNGDFTIDFWVRYPSIQHNVGTFSWDYQSISTISLWTMTNTGDKFCFDLYSDQGNRYMTQSVEVLTNTWYHVAFVRSGALVNYYIDGVEKASDNVGTDTFDMSSKSLFLGTSRTTAYHCNCWIDEFRIVKGTACWSTDFTPQNYENGRVISGSIISTPIILPQRINWSTLSINKIENTNTHINTTIIDNSTNQIISGYKNRTERNIDISNITADSIRLKAWFSGDGHNTPTLDSWGLDWTAENAWRDSFVGDGKCIYPVDVDEHTVGYWKFEEGGGNFARDLSGNGNDGIIHGANWTQGRFGRGLKFDGVNDYIDCGNDSSLTNLSSFTVESWFNVADISSFKSIVGKGGYDWDEEFILGLQGDHLYFDCGEGGAGDWWGEGGSIETNKWYNLVGVYDSHLQTGKIFLNGIIIPDIGTMTGHQLTSDQHLQIGASRGLRYFFNGFIDEVRISNIARTSYEIRRSYLAGIAIRSSQAELSSCEYDPGADPSCVGYWDFDDGSGTTAEDHSGNENDGALTGSPSWVDGVRGTGLDFDGTDDCMEISLSTSESVTITAWLKPDIGDAAIRVILDKTGNFNLEYRDNKMHQYTYQGDGAYSNTELAVGSWNFISLVRKANAYSFYFNGKYDGGGTTSPRNLVGTYNIGSRGGTRYQYDGCIDEFSMFDRALSPSEIFEHYNFTSSRYVDNATLRSIPITLPSNQTWSTFHFHRAVPENTYLNISVHDSKSNITLATNETFNRTEEYIDLSGIDPINHPSIYLEAHFQSNRTETPILYDWAVNWTPLIKPPELKSPIEDKIIIEDVPDQLIVDLAEHFADQHSSADLLNYTVKYNSDPQNITLAINAFRLFVTRLKENFTGSVSVKILCSNIYDLTILSNIFNITVENVDDAPLWKTTLPPIILDEGMTKTTDWSLDHYILDAENDEMEYVITPENDNITVQIEGDNRLTATAMGDYFGDTYINVCAQECHNHTQTTSNISIPVSVKPVNDPPSVELLSPKDGAVLGDGNVTFRWRAFDVDDHIDDLTFEIFLDTIGDPRSYKSDIAGNSFSVSGLESGTIYYWYVKPSDGKISGSCLNGTWSFSIDENISVPEVVLLSPLPGETMNTTTVNLSWEIMNLTEGEPIYHVFLGNISNDLIEIDRTLDSWFILTDLTDNTDYYWMVTPIIGTFQGRCYSGTWHFTINTTFEIVYNITVEADVEKLDVIHGEDAVFNITVTNNGNVPTMVSIAYLGKLSGFINATDTIVLFPGNSTNILVKLYDTALIAPRSYDLSIEISHPGGTKSLTIPINIITGDAGPGKEGSDTPEKRSISAWLYVAIVMALLLVIAGIFNVMRKRRNEEEESVKISTNTIDADIVKPGESPFTQPPMSYIPPGVQPTPQFAPSVKHEYAQKTGRSVPSAFSASPQVSQEEVRSIESILADVRPEIAPAPQPPAVPAPPPHVEQLPLRGTTPVTTPASPAPQPIPSGPQIVGVDTQFAISDMFLIYVDGRLVKSVSMETKLSEGMDEDIMSGMLTAITDFIKDSFSEESGALKTLQYGKMNIYLERGVGMYLAVVFHGQAPHNLREKMRWLLIRLWEKYKLKLKAWDGSMDGLDGLDIMLRSLMGEAEPQMSEPTKVPTTPPVGSAGPMVSTATEAVMCNICMGVVKTGLQITNCGCGNKFHKSCGDRIGVCPKCNTSLVVSSPAIDKVEAIAQGLLQATVPEVPLPEGFMPPPPEEILKDETKMLPEYSGQRAGESGEMKIDI